MIQLKILLIKSTYSNNRPPYYVAPWEINKRGQVDCKKKFNWVNKNKILPKLVRQVEYFLRTHFEYFLQTCNIILYLILKIIDNILIF